MMYIETRVICFCLVWVWVFYF